MFPFRKKKKQAQTKTKQKFGEKFSILGKSLKEYILNIPSELRSMKEKSKDLAQTNVDLGFQHLRNGYINDAVFRFKMALRFKKDYAAAYYGLGSCRYTEENVEDAKKHFQKTLSIDPDYVEAQYMLALLGDNILPTHIPQDIVHLKFSSLAAQYNQYFVGQLNYQAHELVYEAVEEVFPNKEEKRDFLDLGCGTGLIGQLFHEKKQVRSLTGVDINPDMLAQTKALVYNYKPVYNVLKNENIYQYLKGCEQKFDVILAVNSLHYDRKLSDILTLCRNALKPEGVIGIAVAKSSGKEVELQIEQGNFAYTQPYIESQVKAAGLTAVISKEALLYDEYPGYICVLKAA